MSIFTRTVILSDNSDDFDGGNCDYNCNNNWDHFDDVASSISCYYDGDYNGYKNEDDND